MYNFKKPLFVFVILTLLIFTGCGGSLENEGAAIDNSAINDVTTDNSTIDNARDEDLLTLTEAEFPRMDGSTATIPLGEAVAAVLMGIDRAEASRFVNFTGTHNSFINLLNNSTADLLIVYEPAEDTWEDLRQRPQIRYDNQIIYDKVNMNIMMRPIGSDGLVFIVNAANPVNNLTVEQVRDIYSGVVTNWNQVGGPNEPIAAFQRNVTAGSHALLMSLLMKDTELMVPPQNFIYAGMGGMVGAVAQFDGGQFAIGYNVFYYVTEMVKDPNVKVLSINGVAPTQETIGNGEYPLTNNFYAVIRPDEPQNSPAYKIFDWLQSPEGQALIHLEGYAAINPPR